MTSQFKLRMAPCAFPTFMQMAVHPCIVNAYGDSGHDGEHIDRQQNIAASRKSLRTGPYKILQSADLVEQNTLVESATYGLKKPPLG